ncbi:MAG: NHL repeat-containing protein [Rubrivivax sp.]|jgi:sugar lactone lactonase YvrE
MPSPSTRTIPAALANLAVEPLPPCATLAQAPLSRRRVLALGTSLGLGLVGCGGGGDNADDGPAGNRGIVTTLAGTANRSGSADGVGGAASFNFPKGLAIDRSGVLYVGDTLNQLIRKVTPSGVVTTLAGSVGVSGRSDGQGAAASFKSPEGLAVDANGTLYVADRANHLIRKVTADGMVSTFVGSGAEGRSNGTGTAASFRFPSSVALDTSGNLYVADSGNELIRKVTPAGVVTTLAGSGSTGRADGPAEAASFNGVYGLALDASGHVYVADFWNNLIRKVTPTGAVSTLAGSGAAGSADGTGANASFSGPYALALEASGQLTVSDKYNRRVRQISPAGVVTTLAGSGTKGSIDGTGANASFDNLSGIVVDGQGAIYVIDGTAHVLRKIV